MVFPAIVSCLPVAGMPANMCPSNAAALFATSARSKAVLPLMRYPFAC